MNNIQQRFICIDFDGTIVTHEYPKIGKPVKGAIEVMKELHDCGHKLILLTMRGGNELIYAVEYCRKNGIEFFAVNENPTQNRWTDSKKVYGNIYIDDAAIGCPLITPDDFISRDYIDWDKVRVMLVDYGIL